MSVITIIFIITLGVTAGVALGYLLRYEAPKVAHVYSKRRQDRR